MHRVPQYWIWQSEFTTSTFSSLHNDWSYVRLCNLIGTNIATGCFWPLVGQKQLVAFFLGQKQPMVIFVPIKLDRRT
jgi:hypothetical protein